MKVLCVDIGTTNIKGGYYQETAQVHLETMPVQTYQTDAGHLFQKPAEIVETIDAIVKKLIDQGMTIDALAFSTPMHTLIDGERMILWSDLRAADWVDKFKRSEPERAEAFYRRTGTPIHPMSPFAKIAYWQEEEKRQGEAYFGLKEYLMDYYIGEHVIDYASASATGLFNLQTLTWDEEVLRYLNVDKSQLASCVDTDYVKEMTPKRAIALGLAESIPVYIGATDGCLASLAAFSNDGFDQVVTLGTSGAARKLVKQPQLASEGTAVKNFCYYLNEDYWVIGGPTNNGGNILDWMASLLFEDKTQFYTKLPGVLQEVPIGAQNLSVYPYLNGERAPFWQANKTGQIKGLRANHGRAHFMKAGVEGVLFNLKQIAQGMVFEGPISLNGGFFQVEGMAQLCANILQQPCIYTQSSEPIDGLIILINKKQPQVAEKVMHLIQSDPDQALLYQEAYERWLEGNED